MTPLPNPEIGDETGWVQTHLAQLASDTVVASPRFRGGQPAADAALDGYSVAGYAARRNEVWPEARRGASALSPYIRHNLLTLRRVWDHVAAGPSSDVKKFRDELMWQEYARHLYARVGAASQDWIRHRVDADSDWDRPPWDRDMKCLDLAISELLEDGWLVNQARMWLASQWTVREGRHWRSGEDAFFRQLLDGSRAANRLGWLWTSGGGTGKAYGFGRWQVEKRAPGLCESCVLDEHCPIRSRPPDPQIARVEEPPALRADPEPAWTAGPSDPEISDEPDVVWLTAESLGDADPALQAHPDLPVIFVFDQPLLRTLRLSGKRLVFLAECLAHIGSYREMELHLGRPRQVLADRRPAVTFAPVPGFRRLRAQVEPVALHPYPWLRRPGAGSVASFSQWRKS